MSDSHAQLPTIRSRTLAHRAEVAGHTLFTGVHASVTIQPAPPHAGLSFRRTDLPGSPTIPVRADLVREVARRTVLSLNPADPNAPSVQTVEHLLSALAGLGITDARIDLHGPELPIGDGSASLFVDAITAAGVSDRDEPVKPLVISRHHRVASDDQSIWIEASPLLASDTPGLHLEYHLDYSGMPGVTPAVEPSLKGERSFIATGHFSDAGTQTYRDQIAPARTFSLAVEVQAARAMGLFTHLSPRDMLVIGPGGPIDNAFRFPDEPIRHKLLDLLGDLAAIGSPIVGRIVAHRTGHAMNNRLARVLVEHP